MKCKVGVHTGRIEVYFDPATYHRVREGLPAKVGRRSWYVAERGGRIVLRRTAYGCTANLVTHRGRNDYRIVNDCDTIVRHATEERPCELVDGELHVRMPPHHEWPWIADGRGRLSKIGMAEWRWRLVQELNARARSATEHHVDVPEPPAWVKEMLTRAEYLSHMSSQEVLS